MNITIDINGDAKEIAALIDQLQERPSVRIDKDKIARSLAIHGTCEDSRSSERQQSSGESTEVH